MNQPPSKTGSTLRLIMRSSRSSKPFSSHWNALSLSPSIASSAKSFRSKCGSVRERPERHKQRSPGGAPHAGQATEVNCLSLRSLILMLVAAPLCWLRDPHFGRGDRRSYSVPTFEGPCHAIETNFPGCVLSGPRHSHRALPGSVSTPLA